MRRVISLWLPTFAIDRINHRAYGKSQANPSGKTIDKPLATITCTHGGQRITAVNSAAQAVGIVPKQSLADARTLYPSLTVHQADPTADLKALNILREICERYTPWVAIDTFDNTPSNVSLWNTGLWLNITGCAHLFGSEEALLEDLFYLLKNIGYQARAGLASTPGAAWALARYKTDPQTKRWFISNTNEDIRNCIAELPMKGLRLECAIIEGLERMGLLSIGDLYRIPRAPITRRFGKSVLHRLDQALGDLEESLSPQRGRSTFSKYLAFIDPIGRREDIEAALNRLVVSLCTDLEQANQGARRLVLTLYRVDKSTGKVQISTSQPRRDPTHLSMLFREKLEIIDPGLGIDAIVLSASETNPLKVRQTGLNINSIAEQTENVIKLLDRLVGRLGSDNVTRLEPVERHLPELASREVSTASIPSGVKQDWGGPTHCPSRPLQLLVHPLRIDVIAEIPDGPPFLFYWQNHQRRVIAAEGPERITPEWWLIRGNMWKTKPLNNDVRDYYRIEDKDGKRYWLYREGLYYPDNHPTWYIHGFFA